MSRRIPLETFGTVEICYSQLTSWFRLWLSGGHKLDKWEITIPIVMAQLFIRCFVARQELLASPQVRTNAWPEVQLATESALSV